MSSKEADLMTAGLMYLSRCLVEGDLHALQRLGLTHQEVAALRDLRLSDVLRTTYSERRGNFLEIRFDRYALWRHFEYLEAQRKTEQTLLALIRADAPREMLAQLLGVSPQEYRRYCVLLGLSAKAGRPAEPDEASTQRVWQAWRAITAQTPVEDLRAEHYLTMHQETGLSLRLIWGLV